MEEVWICLKSVIKANQIKMFLSSELMNINKIYIDKEKEKILKESDCSSCEDYFIKINTILKNSKYVKNRDKNLVIYNENEDNNTKMMKSFQKIVSLHLLDKII
jgi:formylmethanofuran dehydrogenase subunit E